MSFAPIALFVYNRPVHTRQAIDALRNNELAKESELFIFADGLKDKKADEGVTRVREYIRSVSGFKKIAVIEHDRNLGVAGSVIAGVTDLVSRYGKVIVLEDDLLVSPYFLKYMNDALLLYENENSVLSICGYMYPVEIKDQETFFFRIPDSWGWATWKRGWDLFTADGKKLYDDLKRRNLLKSLDLEGAFDFTGMLKMKIRGKNDSWGVCWYAASLLNKKLCLYPARSLVMNTGIDGSGRHRGIVDYFKTEPANEPVAVRSIPICENESAAEKIKLFLAKNRFNKIGNKVFEFFHKLGII